MLLKQSENENRKIKYIALDVDGTLTDGGIYYDGTGNEWKKFSVKDGAGIKIAQKNGVEIVVISGRECGALTRRMSELGVKYLFQNIQEKESCLKAFMQEKNIQRDELAYIGDDINDLDAMGQAGFKACPADADERVKAQADYISRFSGGYGAVRDVIEYLLIDRGDFD